MKKLLSYMMMALIATSAISFAAAPTEEQMMDKEKGAWQAFKDKNADAFKKFVSEEMVGVYDDGASDMTKELADMQKWDMKSFEISNFKQTAEGPNGVAVTYVVKIEGTYNGKDASGTFNAGSVWVKERGNWKAIFHTNVKQAAGG